MGVQTLGDARKGGRREPHGGAPSLSDRVLQVSEVIEQGEDGPYTFVVDTNDPDASEFTLAKDDCLSVIGLLNSPDFDSARRQIRQVLSKLERPAVEGLALRFYLALKRQEQELAALSMRSHSRRPQTSQRPQAAQRPESRGMSPVEPTPQARDRLRRQDQPTPQSHREGWQSERGSSMERMENSERRTNSSEPAPARNGTPQRVPDAQQRNGSTGRRDLPEVFKRLTGQPKISDTPESTNGAEGELARDTASTYLKSLLEAYRQSPEKGISDSLDDRREDRTRKSPRVPEAQAQQIFDRLYNSAKEFRVRQRVYQEFGMMAEEALNAQSCTFEPQVSSSGRAGDTRQIADRLHKEGAARRARREELQAKAVVPSFRPQLKSKAQPDVVPRQESTYVRLFRENEARKKRQEIRQEEMADWKKHEYRPDIAKSQASGPQIQRAQSELNFHGADAEDGYHGRDSYSDTGEAFGEIDEYDEYHDHQLHSNAGWRDDLDAQPHMTLDKTLAGLSRTSSATFPSSASPSPFPRNLSGTLRCPSPAVSEGGSAVVLPSATHAIDGGVLVVDAGGSTSPSGVESAQTPGRIQIGTAAGTSVPGVGGSMGGQETHRSHLGGPPRQSSGALSQGSITSGGVSTPALSAKDPSESHSQSATPLPGTPSTSQAGWPPGMPRAIGSPGSQPPRSGAFPQNAVQQQQQQQQLQQQGGMFGPQGLRPQQYGQPGMMGHHQPLTNDIRGMLHSLQQGMSPGMGGIPGRVAGYGGR